MLLFLWGLSTTMTAAGAIAACFIAGLSRFIVILARTAIQTPLLQLLEDVALLRLREFGTWLAAGIIQGRCGTGLINAGREVLVGIEVVGHLADLALTQGQQKAGTEVHLATGPSAVCLQGAGNGFGF